MEFLNEHLDQWDECIIVSDSEFWINMFTVYMPRWARENIEFNTKKNSDITEPMYAMFVFLTEEQGKTIEFRHIRSHNQ